MHLTQLNAEIDIKLSFPQAKRVGNLTIRHPLDSGQAGMTDGFLLTRRNNR